MGAAGASNGGGSSAADFGRAGRGTAGAEGGAGATGSGAGGRGGAGIRRPDSAFSGVVDMVFPFGECDWNGRQVTGGHRRTRRANERMASQPNPTAPTRRAVKKAQAGMESICGVRTARRPSFM